MTPKIKEAIAVAATRLQSLTKEEFAQRLREHSEGELACVLMGKDHENAETQCKKENT